MLCLLLAGKLHELVKRVDEYGSYTTQVFSYGVWIDKSKIPSIIRCTQVSNKQNHVFNSIP
jgi:hypothetical protein